MMTESVPPLGSFDPLVHRARVGQQFLQDAVDAAGVAAALRGLLALDGVELLEHLHRDGEVVVLELEDRLRVVQQDVRVEHEGLTFAVTLFRVTRKSGQPSWSRSSTASALASPGTTRPLSAHGGTGVKCPWPSPRSSWLRPPSKRPTGDRRVGVLHA
jgi:hypothetical protein